MGMAERLLDRYHARASSLGAMAQMLDLSKRSSAGPFAVRALDSRSSDQRYSYHKPRIAWTLWMLFVLVTLFSSLAHAASVEFQNCLSAATIHSNPRRLQFTPLHVAAYFDVASETNSLNVTIYGNVSGQTTTQTLPPPSSPEWHNPSFTLGKIVDLSERNNKYTTLFSRYNVLSYTPWNAPPARFCNASIHGQCPLGPAFFVSPNDLARLPAFSIAHNMFSTYAFTSITATVTVESGDLQGSNIACILATITPDLGASLRAVLRYLPLAILLSVGLATILAAIISPWGSVDIFRWSSNYGRDEDLLRLVTPGFGDCLQYLQFIILTGSLTLNYPGFFQPAVSRVGWSTLMFNESFVSGGHGIQPVVDGVYQYRQNTTYGLDRMSQLIGMQSPRDIWADMMVWLVVLTGGVAILTQAGFATRWLWRQARNVPPEDLRSKNGPFTAGNVIRLTLNYFLLPLVSLSMFQLVIATQGPSYSVGLAAVVIAAIIGFSVRLMFLFSRTRPRSFLFDDLVTVLAYGPLYNTYCDDAAVFGLIPIFLNFIRGIAIGAVQPSGIAQLVLLAICEIIFVLTLNAFRPFPTASSMNLYHTLFASIRLVTILLSIAFVPSLGVGPASRGWIGYAILLVHACVLIFGFFLNAIQTIIEVIARGAGADSRQDGGQGPTRGGLSRVFGMRQLSRRMPRREQQSRHSMASNAAILAAIDPEQKSLRLENTRSRTLSASSTMLLKQQSNDQRRSQVLDGASGEMSPGADSSLSRPWPTPRLSGLSGTMSPGGIINLNQVESKDPYYRQPRRNTMEMLATPEQRSRMSMARSNQTDEEAVEDDAGEGASTAPVRDDFEDNATDFNKPKPDYAVREVDFYYRVRGPPLSSGTRKLKTGPADPTGPVSSATGWFKGLLGGKTKEKNKGFEVVRSSRVPPGLMPPHTPEDGPTPEPYMDEPEPSDRPRKDIDTMTEEQEGPDATEALEEPSSDEEFDIPRAPSTPPTLPHIDSVGAIELPSRIGSQASKVSKKKGAVPEGPMPPVPAIPRKSSRRTSSQDAAEARAAGFPRTRLSTIAPSPLNSPQRPTYDGPSRGYAAEGPRVPFQNVQATTPRSNRYSIGLESTSSSQVQHEGEENMGPSTSRYAGSPRESEPSSMGYVHQHRTSDNIHYNPDENVARSAELFGRRAE